MFERFTERGRQVVVLAQQEARALKHEQVGTEHLLLGLLAEPEGLAAEVLRGLGLELETARVQVVRAVGEGQGSQPGEPVPLTYRAKQALELSLREALSLGHNYIGTEHVLLGLVRDGEGVAARVLRDFDVDAERVREAVIAALMAGSPARDKSSAAPRPRERFEHKLALLEEEAGLTGLEAELKRAAAGGWELVSVLRLELGLCTFFKRPHRAAD